jgi:ROK family
MSPQRHGIATRGPARCTSGDAIDGPPDRSSCLVPRRWAPTDSACQHCRPAGEIGHITLDDQGPPCRCGKRGCLEAHTFTPFVQQELEKAGMHLGSGVANIVKILNPRLVVIGVDLLLEPTRIGLRRYTLDPVADTPVVSGEVGSRASAVARSCWPRSGRDSSRGLERMCWRQRYEQMPCSGSRRAARSLSMRTSATRAQHRHRATTRS